MLAFTKEEFKSRVQRVKEKMEEEGIEVLLLSDPANLYCVSGYDAISYYVPQVVIVCLDWEEPVIIVRGQDHYCATETCWMQPENILSYPDPYLWEPKKLHAMDFVADFLIRPLAKLKESTDF